jgi:ferritin-like metal-binding protein YciE
MAATSLQELFVEELRDMYDGEKRLLRALPKMARAATSDELQTAFDTHAKETAKQVSRLEQVFRTIGEKARGKKCDGIMGIVEEGNHAIETLDGAVLDAALIAGAQKVEHYEIATYGTLAYFAELLGQGKAKDLLGETLDEEKATDEKLSGLAKSDVNREALLAAGNEREKAPARSSGMMTSVRRAATSLGLASKRSSRRGATSRRNSKRRQSRSTRSRRRSA